MVEILKLGLFVCFRKTINPAMLSDNYCNMEQFNAMKNSFTLPIGATSSQYGFGERAQKGSDLLQNALSARQTLQGIVLFSLVKISSISQLRSKLSVQEIVDNTEAINSATEQKKNAKYNLLVIPINNLIIFPGLTKLLPNEIEMPSRPNMNSSPHSKLNMKVICEEAFDDILEKRERETLLLSCLFAGEFHFTPVPMTETNNTAIFEPAKSKSFQNRFAIELNTPRGGSR